MNIGDRLKLLRKCLNLSAKEMADSLNIPVRTIGGYERGENPPNEKFLTQLILVHNVNINWLLSEKGPMFIQEKNTANYINLPSNISPDEAESILKIIENDITREMVLKFIKAKNGDMKSIDSLIQNFTGIKVAYL